MTAKPGLAQGAFIPL